MTEKSITVRYTHIHSKHCQDSGTLYFSFYYFSQRLEVVLLTSLLLHFLRKKPSSFFSFFVHCYTFFFSFCASTAPMITTTMSQTPHRLSQIKGKPQPYKLANKQATKQINKPKWDILWCWASLLLFSMMSQKKEDSSRHGKPEETTKPPWRPYPTLKDWLAPQWVRQLKHYDSLNGSDVFGVNSCSAPGRRL